MLQIKRFQFNHVTGLNEKLINEFKYPETVNFSKWMYDCKEEPTYELYGVLVHEGSKAQSGHYYAYLKVEDEWFKFNDEVVEAAPAYKTFLYNFGGSLTTIDLNVKELRVEQSLIQSKRTAYLLVYINQSLKGKLMARNDSYPEWLLQFEKSKMVMEEERRAKK